MKPQVLEEFGHAVPAEHSNDKWVAFAWPQRIAQQCEDTAGLLKQSRSLFQEEVGEIEPASLKSIHFFYRIFPTMPRLVGKISYLTTEIKQKTPEDESWAFI